KNLKGNRLRGVSFDVCEGEIVGIAGVEGNGQSELLKLLLHYREMKQKLKSKVSGEIEVMGQKSSSLSPLQIKNLGVGFVPEDRHRDAILMGQSLESNFFLGHQRDPRFSRRGWISRSSLRSFVTSS